MGQLAWDDDCLVAPLISGADQLTGLIVIEDPLIGACPPMTSDAPCACWPIRSPQGSALLAAADRGLYAAKAAGRDRSVLSAIGV